jgi:hypothetical protein
MHDLGYALVDGTAVVLYYKHRLSVDLDWFSVEPMGDAMVLARRLQEEISFQITDIGPGTLHILVDGVRVSFLEYRYPLLHPVKTEKHFSCPIASLDDLACMKLSAIAQRGSRKDFIDLFTIVQNHRPFSTLLDLYRQKYSVKDITPILYGMVYFDNAVCEPLPEKWDGSWLEVENACRMWVKDSWKEYEGS